MVLPEDLNIREYNKFDPHNNIKSTVLTADSPSVDAFGRWRVSAPHTIFDAQNEYNDSPLFYETVLTGAGISTHVPNESAVNLTVGTAGGDKVVRQSKEYFRYVPGKSFLVVLSRVMGVPKANTRQRIGYFDAQNGLYFENNGTNFGVVQRSYTSGSVVETRITQANFNLDKLDGTGASGITLDLSKANIFMFDLEWLGVGRVRFGIFGSNGNPVYCHEIDNSNTNTTSYMRTANLPLRNEVENTGISASNTTLKVICSTVVVEDGEQIATGIPGSANNGVSAIAVTTRRAILSIRPKLTFNSIVNRAKIEELKVLIQADAAALWEVVYNGALGGTPSWASVGASNTVEKDVAGTTVTGGIVIASGYISASLGSETANISSSLISKLPFGLNIAGDTPIILSLVVTSVTGTANSLGSFTWKEIY